MGGASSHTDKRVPSDTSGQTLSIFISYDCTCFLWWLTWLKLNATNRLYSIGYRFDGAVSNRFVTWTHVLVSFICLATPRIVVSFFSLFTQPTIFLPTYVLESLQGKNSKQIFFIRHALWFVICWPEASK